MHTHKCTYARTHIQACLKPGHHRGRVITLRVRSRCPPVDRIYKRVGLQLNDDSFSGGTLPKKNVHLLSVVVVEIDCDPMARPFVKLCTSAKVLLRL
ncbi:unnamed protein product [Cercopithifilaria johnstoni]|uniref:Uncharacterized protein n=1 Tax=Cercopithifilaria johnstoni TaxID=2874296 RepID=A0A8J2M2Y5_9BILA|nr:unnamed protein product [Cercopithifilaria johnstoni]